jgi:hypothetical protein
MSAVALCAADNQASELVVTNEITTLDYITLPYFADEAIDPSKPISASVYIPPRIDISEPGCTNIVWSIDDTTNRLDMAVFLQVDTNWFPIAKGTNIPPAVKPGDVGVKEIGEIQTNRYLTIVYFGKTNKFLMGSVGKEEWPSQNRYRLEVKPPGQPQPAKR